MFEVLYATHSGQQKFTRKKVANAPAKVSGAQKFGRKTPKNA